MFDPQSFVNLQDGVGFGGDPSSWLSCEDRPSSPSHRRTLSSFSNATASGNLDPVLFNDLVQMVPLVQSLIDRQEKTSYTRRGSMIYTKTPSREFLSKKTIEAKGRNALQSIPRKKGGEKDQDDDANGCSNALTGSMFTEREREELNSLREQVEDLQKKLLDKDEILKSAEASKSELTSLYDKLEDLNKLISEKDSLLKSTNAQLSDAKTKLADRQAAVERLQWEVATSNEMVEKLQEDLSTVQAEMASFMVLFEGLAENNYAPSADDYDVSPYTSHLPDMGDLHDIDTRKMEELREAYIVAIAAAREKQDEESIALAASARFHLHSFVMST